jgi:hypothetical protein
LLNPSIWEWEDSSRSANLIRKFKKALTIGVFEFFEFCGHISKFSLTLLVGASRMARVIVIEYPYQVTQWGFILCSFSGATKTTNATWNLWAGNPRPADRDVGKEPLPGRRGTEVLKQLVAGWSVIHARGLALPGWFENTARCQLFGNWYEEGSNGCGHFPEILGHIFSRLLRRNPRHWAAFAVSSAKLSIRAIGSGRIFVPRVEKVFEMASASSKNEGREWGTEWGT